MTGRSLEDVQDEILDKLHAGEPVDREAILARHPEHAAALRRFFDLVAVIEQPAEPKPSQPSRLGEFEIIREIGRGGMGVVYEARQVSLNRRVALKVLPPAMRGDRRLLARFRREAEAAARLRHPNIVPVYSIGESAGAPFFAMELVEGRSLADVIKARKAGSDAGLPPAGEEYRRWAVNTAAKIAEALDYAHGRGILHRDIKPGNILLEADGAPRLTDFGLALDLQASELTQSGEVFGSPLYMSPEQAFRREAPVDARTDIYSLAVTLYELLALRLPYAGTTHAELMAALSSGRIVAPREADPGCPEPLERVLVQALRSDPHERYATAAKFAADLRAALERPEEVRAAAVVPVGARRPAEAPAPVSLRVGPIASSRWRWTLGGLLVVWILVALGEGGAFEFLILGALGALVGYWLGGRAERRRAAAAAPPPVVGAAGTAAAGGAPPPPRVRDRFRNWRRESPVFSTGLLGCGCLVMLMFLMAPCILLFGRHEAARVSVSETEGRDVHGVSIRDAVFTEGDAAAALERLRSLSLPYDLSMNALMPKAALEAGREERRLDYPAPAWPPMLGGLSDLDPAPFDIFDFEGVDGADPFSTAEPRVVIEGPLEGRFMSRGSQALLCPEGIAYGGGVTAQGYCTLLVAGDMDGRIVFESYATLIVGGDLSGSVEAGSYVDILVHGDLTGRFVGQEYSLLYIEGRLLGDLELGAQSKVYIQGRTESADLARIRGPGTAFVLLEDSDLEPGEHQVGGHTVQVLP